MGDVSGGLIGGCGVVASGGSSVLGHGGLQPVHVVADAGVDAGVAGLGAGLQPPRDDALQGPVAGQWPPGVTLREEAGGGHRGKPPRWWPKAGELLEMVARGLETP